MALGAQKFMGKEYDGILRTIFILNKEEDLFMLWIKLKQKHTTRCFKLYQRKLITNQEDLDF